MKTLREYIEEVEDPTNEDLRSAAVGAALAGTMALGQPAAAQDLSTPSPQQQIRAAVQSGDVPRGDQYSAKTRGGWITEITVNGKTYDVRHRIPDQGNRTIAAADQVRTAMMREEELEESQDDEVDRVVQLAREMR